MLMVVGVDVLVLMPMVVVVVFVMDFVCRSTGCGRPVMLLLLLMTMMRILLLLLLLEVIKHVQLLLLLRHYIANPAITERVTHAQQTGTAVVQQRWQRRDCGLN
jgi:hypothetical protein